MSACCQMHHVFAGYIDQAWHEIILDTRLYRRHCEALGVPFIHHNPDGGSEAERYERYKYTLHCYEQRFGPPPPLAWDSLEQAAAQHRDMVGGDVAAAGTAPARC